MDGQRFDELARKLGSGLSRRQLVRVLFGGGAALTTTALIRKQVSAQVGPGGPCEDADDCTGDLICGQQNTCECNPSVSQDGQCPEGSPVSGNSGLEDSCCNGHGNCCSRNCVEGACGPALACSQQGVECEESDDCCEGLICVTGFCGELCTEPCDPCESCIDFGEGAQCLSDCGVDEICCEDECIVAECCDFTDCTETNECFRAACYQGVCVYSPADDLCTGDCEVCNDLGECVSACETGQLCCPGEPDICAECCDADDCTATNECYVAQCVEGACQYTADPALCTVDCESCNADTGLCESECAGAEICCPGTPDVCAECCDADDCTATSECFVAQCVEGTCQYTPDQALCPEACEICSENGVCVADCVQGEICCNDQCIEGECCDADDCTETEACFEAACYEGQCVYTPDDDLCADLGDCSNKECTVAGSCSYTQDPQACSGCEFCSDEFVCTDGCPSGEVCCGEACVEGECCVDDDCDPESCAVVSCYQGECVGISLCPPQQGSNIQCCPVEGGEDYCYDLEEGTCCFDEECGQVLISNESCLISACVQGICVEIPDDDRCGKDECCCENGQCSLDCCDNTCKSDKDCPKGTICCAGVCREIECCIDDILTGGNPNDRCPDKCTCFEGLCVDHNQERCVVCRDDKDCGKDTCCCKDGSCSARCCPDTTTTSVPIGQLPNTGAGPDTSDASWLAGAALAAGAAAVLGSRIRKDITPAEEPEN